MSAIIHIQDDTNRILNILKAKYDLKDKSASIDLMAKRYSEEILEPELRPEFVRKTAGKLLEKPIKVGSVAQLRKRYE